MKCHFSDVIKGRGMQASVPDHLAVTETLAVTKIFGPGRPEALLGYIPAPFCPKIHSRIIFPRCLNIRWAPFRGAQNAVKPNVPPLFSGPCLRNDKPYHRDSHRFILYLPTTFSDVQEVQIPNANSMTCKVTHLHYGIMQTYCFS